MNLILKTIIWRFIATSTTFTTAYVIDGDYTKAIYIVAIDTTLKTLFYYLYERGIKKCETSKIPKTNNKSVQTIEDIIIE